jgi:polyhydroxyalkanoate synthesis repressor PhaR
MPIIRRYSNRKLYDTRESHYTTLTAIAALLRAGEDIRVFHHDSNRDLTNETLALIIYEEEREHPQLSVRALYKIIRTRELP